MPPKLRSMLWTSSVPTGGSGIGKYWHTKWQHGFREGMTMRRRSTGTHFPQVSENF